MPNTQVSNRVGMGQANVTQSGGTSGANIMQTAMFTCQRAVTQIQFKWANYSVDSTPSKLNAGEYPVSIKAAIVYGGSFYPILFPSGRTVTLQPDELVTSLPLSLSISAGSSYELRWYLVYSNAPVNFPATTRFNTDGGNMFGASASDLVDSVTPLSGTSTVFMILPPYQVVGNASGLIKSVMVMGDSITTDGSDDAYQKDVGFMARVLNSVGIPFITNGASGNSMIFQTQSWASTPAQMARRAKAYIDSGVSHVFCGLCTNDFSSGQTAAQLLANHATFKAILDPYGIKYIPMTCWPKTNATNDAVDATISARRLSYNASIRSAKGVGYGYLDIAALTSATLGGSPSATGEYWRTDLGSPTSDGTHPSPAIHDYLVTQLAQPIRVVTGIWKQS